MDKNKKYNERLADTLNECFESVLIKGESVDSCLARHPEYFAELKPLLETMKAARAAASISPDPSFRARARYEFHGALNDKIAPKTHALLPWRWATIASTLGVFLLTSVGGAVAASSSSMPGQPLYQLKRTIENVQLTLAPSQADKARFYAVQADHRISEILYTAQSGDVKVTEDLTQQFTADLSMVSSIAESTRWSALGNPSKQSGATAGESPIPAQTTSTYSSDTAGATNGVTTQASSLPPAALATGVTAAVSPLPTAIVSSPPAPVTSSAAASPTLTESQPQASLSGITDPVLLKLLQQYSVKNVAELMSVLDKVPPSAREALLAALQAATSAYGQILGS